MFVGMRSLDDGACSMIPPSGWTAIDSGTHNGAGDSLNTALYWKRATGAETSLEEADFDKTNVIYYTIVIAAYKDAILNGSPFNAVQSAHTKSVASTTNEFGNGVTTTQDGCKIVLLSAATAVNSSSDYTGSPTPTEQVDTPDGFVQPQVNIADYVQAAAGATGSHSATYSGSARNNGYTLAFASSEP